MKLYYSPFSPYARKVLVAAHENGLSKRIEPVLANPQDEALRAITPLSKIPVLILEDGSALYDSRVICEYLDALGGGALIPASGPGRLRARRLEALGDGISDAVLRIAMENRRAPDDRHADVIARQMLAIAAGLAEAQRHVTDEVFTLGDAAIACGIGYLELRVAEYPWRGVYPALARWFDAVAARPSMVALPPMT